MSISVLVHDYEKMFKFLTQSKVKKSFAAEWIYWIFAQNYLLSLNLFWKVMLNLRVDRVDQNGFNRIRASYDMLRRELREFVKKAYDYIQKDGVSSPEKIKMIKDTINEEKDIYQAEIEKCNYVLDFIAAPEAELKNMIAKVKILGCFGIRRSDAIE